MRVSGVYYVYYSSYAVMHSFKYLVDSSVSQGALPNEIFSLGLGLSMKMTSHVPRLLPGMPRFQHSYSYLAKPIRFQPSYIKYLVNSRWQKRMAFSCCTQTSTPESPPRGREAHVRQLHVSLAGN